MSHRLCILCAKSIGFFFFFFVLFLFCVVFKFRLTKYQIFKKLPLMLHIYKYRNFLSIIRKRKSNCFYPINFVAGTCKESSFSCCQLWTINANEDPGYVDITKFAQYNVANLKQCVKMYKKKKKKVKGSQWALCFSCSIRL